MRKIFKITEDAQKRISIKYKEKSNKKIYLDDL